MHKHRHTNNNNSFYKHLHLHLHRYKRSPGRRLSILGGVDALKKFQQNKGVRGLEVIDEQEEKEKKIAATKKQIEEQSMQKLVCK